MPNAGPPPAGAPGPSRDDFRTTLGHFASGVTIVTATADGQNLGMTLSAFCSLSLDPPLVVVCVDRGATLHDVLREGAVFGVNVLAAGQEALSRRFAKGEPGERFVGVGHARGALGAPLLDGTVAWLECTVGARYPGGDHTIVVGAVAEVGVHEGAGRDGGPLLYYRSGYASLER